MNFNKDTPVPMEVTRILPQSARQAVPRRGLRRVLEGTIPHVILLSYTRIALFPVFLIVITSFKSRQAIFSVPYQPPTPETFDLVGYATVFARASFGQYFLNSFIVTAAALFFILLAGAMAAFALAE